MAHKITAIRLTGHKGVLTISGMTQSPRGTRVIAKSVQIETKGDDRKTRTGKIKAAVRSLLPETAPTG